MKRPHLLTFLCMLVLVFSLPAYAANPTVAEVDSIQAVTFNGADTFLKSTFPTDGRYNGTSAWTVIVKAYTSLVNGERPMFSWAQRGGAGSSWAQMNYNTGGSGAIVHGGADSAWYAGTTTAPAINLWHYLAITYAGGGTTDEYFYVDGIQTNHQLRTLNLKSDQAMYIGTVDEGNGTFTRWYPGSIARLHVYDYALTPEEIADISDESEEMGTQPPLIRLEAENLDDGELDFWDNEGTIGKGFGQLALVTNVAATKATSYNTVTVTWDQYDDPGDKIYYVYRFTADLTANAVVVGVLTNTTEYADMDVALDVTYYYWVKCMVTRGMTEFSLSDTGNIIPRLYSPHGAAASYELYTDKIRVAWNPVGAATKYKVFRNTVDDAATATELAEVTVTLLDDSAPTDVNQVYYYWVKAGDAADAWSTFSDGAAGKLKDGEPDGWPMYSGDAQNRGFNNGPNVLSTATLVWSNGFKGYNLRSPVIDDDTIYLACWPENDAADSTDLFAINLSDGSIKYKVDLPNPIFGGAAVYGDKIFVGEYGSEYNTHVYCLDKKTGAIVWQRTLDVDFCTSAIKIFGGDLYFCSGASIAMSSVYRIDAVTGEDVWRIEDSGIRAWYWGGNEPAISVDGNWVVTRGEAPHHILGIDNTAGDTNWVITGYLNPYPNQNPLFDSNGNAYSLVRDDTDGNVFRIVKVNAGTGAQTWKSAPLGDASSWPTWEIYGQASPAISPDESTIYVPHSRGDTDSILAVNTANGSVKWTVAITNLGHGEAPLVTGTGGMVMGIAGNKNEFPFIIKAFGVKDNGANGSVEWTIPLPGPNDLDPFTSDALQWDDWPSDACPALTREGNLVVTTRGGILALIQPPGSAPEPPAVVASDTLTDKIAASWASGAGATGYQLYRSTNPADPAPAAVGGVVTGTTYDDTSVVAETAYYYWVKSQTAGGWSDYSGLDEGFMLNAAGMTISNVNFAYGIGTVAMPFDFFSGAALPIDTRMLNVAISGGNVYDLTVTRTGGSSAFSADCEAYVNKDGSTDLTITYISDGSNTMFQPAEFTIDASNIDPMKVYVQDTPEPGVIGMLLIGLILAARKLR